MAGVVREARKAKNHIDEGLKKVQAEPWAQPLGKALKVTAKVVNGLGTVVPGGGAIGGALSFGATLLNPEISREDLHKELQEIKGLMSVLCGPGPAALAREALEKQQAEIEKRIRTPQAEIRDDFEQVWNEMKDIHKEVGEANEAMAGYMTRMQDQLSKTYKVVTDIRFKVRGNTQDIEDSKKYLDSDESKDSKVWYG